MATTDVTYSAAPWLTSTNGTTGTNSTTSTSKSSTNSLGKDDFLKLLVTQLAAQDPLDPMDDKEFISQMASFSALEQMQNMNTGFTSLKDTITNTLIPQMQLQQSSSLIGQTVSYSGTDKDGKAVTLTGTVDKVVVDNGQAYCVINGKKVNPNLITEIATSSANQLSDLLQKSSSLIGQQISYTSTDSSGKTTTLTGTVDKLVVADGKTYCVVNGKNVDPSSIIGIAPVANNQVDGLVDKLDDLMNILVPEEGAESDS